MMNKGSRKYKMICPCCGEPHPASPIACDNCGARQVGEPLPKPERMLPALGLPMAAFFCFALIVLSYLVYWILGNDMKVGRSLLVQIFGESFEFTRNLVNIDSKLPVYRVFAFDARQAAYILSYGLIPISFIGLRAAFKALKLNKIDPSKFGGARLAKSSLVLCSITAVIFSSVLLSEIPKMLARGKAKREAATMAKMYELHQQGLQKYYAEHGGYPEALADLSRLETTSNPSQSDVWTQTFEYQPVSVVASKAIAAPFSNYKLVSAGSDGKFGTDDDITMIDGIVTKGAIKN